MPEAKDDRRVITPDAFTVAPELLGRPLAAPWRRGMALLADLVLVFLFTQLGSVSVALLATVVIFFLVMREPIERRWLRWTRAVASVAGALVLFATVLVALEWSNPSPFTGMSPEMWAEFGQAAGSQDPEEQARAMEGLVENLQAAGTPPENVHEVVESLGLPPGLMGPLEDLIIFGVSGAGGPETEPPPPDPEVLAPLLEDYAAALRTADESRTNELAPRVEESVAARATARLEQRIAQLRTNARELYAENRELRDQVENPSFRRVVTALSADLGLTFGWSAVYFTLLLAWFRGRTPGKWLFRLRVLRLDDRPLTLWGCFERFAGYAAGLATGLLGFLQVFWDPNRQAIQDKIVGTVVVVEKSVDRDDAG